MAPNLSSLVTYLTPALRILPRSLPSHQHLLPVHKIREVQGALSDQQDLVYRVLLEDLEFPLHLGCLETPTRTEHIELPDQRFFTNQCSHSQLLR